MQEQKEMWNVFVWSTHSPVFTLYKVLVKTALQGTDCRES